MSTSISRRHINTAMMWSAPAIAVSAAAPAMATSPSETPQYGALVVAPWSGSAGIHNWTGKSALTSMWVYFPTTRPKGEVHLSTANSAAETFATPLGGSAAWPVNYPPGTSNIANRYDTTGATYPYPENLSNGVYTGEKVHVNVKVIGGNVSYESYAASPILTGGMQSATDPSKNSGYVTVNGVKGSGATWPQLRLDDNYKNDGGRTAFSYLGFQSQVDGQAGWRTTIHAYSYGTMSQADNGLPQWDWDTVLMYPVDNGNAGAAAVSFELRLSPAQYADAAHQSNATVPVQFLITVTSPWGVVSYTTAAV